MNSYDTALADAVKRDDRAKIAEFLRSDFDLSKGDRGILAEYFEGKWKTTRGNRSGSNVNPIDQRKAVSRYFEEKTKHGNGSSESIIMELISEYGIKRSTFHGWLKEANSAIDGFKKQGLSADMAQKKFIDIARSDEF